MVDSHGVNSHGRFLWYELMTTDTEAAKVFYAKVLGWGTRDASAPGAPYTLFTVDDEPVSGLTRLPEETRQAGVVPKWIGYVGVDDVDAAARRVKELGGTVPVPPTDVPEVSRFAVVTDPQMAVLVLIKWLEPGQDPSVKAGTPGRVGWHELLAADWEKAFAFYSVLFGWRKAEADVDALGTYQQFSAGADTIGGMFTKPEAVPLPFWLYYFITGDVDAAARRVTAGGGRILEGPIGVPGRSRVARCTDPQGAMFALAGTGNGRPLGYFAPASSRDPSAARFFGRR